ncbi:hypothetical protein [Clostridium celatum]|uniref:Lipoprotein n=1 Tax=Clostridium celatum DSM 1785 TaxID=545697 RepID=L1Q2W5_9CLOT|nr:hypothetical protein [Clostridium celatum]EKY22251.1 hypothetical protein HMPREF0216_03295 [Clostridium celatum DSM 1785]MCE9654626.1 hypothetical protein [Clostridium celatum]MDU2265130.1 hypothetical protein [Clostridium celatum]MDU3721745.1 hypothetical protein [Clostridium celatum]MDU6295105.1 hypothetical protein [Clostridium celatum]
MKKKILALMLSSMITITIVGCSNDNNQTNVVSEDSAVQLRQVETLPGEWSNDYTRDEVKALYEEGLARVISTTEGYSLDYSVVENEIKEENGISVNDNYIYFDNENPEKNRLESMYYGFKQFGSDLASGQICMKLGFNLDKESIIEIGEFNIEELSLSAYSAAFTGDYDRDYTELNKEIYDIIEGKDGISSVENNLDGIKETVTITDNFLLYKLETKEYKFK